MTNLPRVSWRKSSFSDSAQDCVEVAATLGAVRDTKNPDAVLEVPMRHLVRSLKDSAGLTVVLEQLTC